MKKREFEYQRYILRLVTIVPLLALMYAIYMVFNVGKDTGLIMMMLLVLLNIIVLVGYYKLTERVPFFKSTGYYYMDEGNVHINIGKKEYVLDDLKEVFSYQSSLFGSMMYCMQIKNGKKKINIYSLPTKKEARFMECSTYHLFKYIISNNKQLKNVKNKSGTFNSEWYKVK